MPRPVNIRYADGREYTIEGGAAVARQVHPDAEITTFADDGSEYSADAARRHPATVASPTAAPGTPPSSGKAA